MKKKFQEAFDLHKKGMVQEAKKIYGEILEETPTDFNCLHHLGLIAKNNKDYLSAFEFISKAIKSNPNSAEAYFNLGNVLKSLNKTDDAIKSYDRAIIIKADYELYMLRGNTLHGVKRFNEALASYDEAIKLKPNSFEAHSDKGLALVELKDIKAAIISYDKAIQINSKFIVAKYNKGLALRLLGMNKESIKIFKEIIKIEPDHHQSLYEMSLIYRGLKEFDLALACCKKILKNNRNHSRAILLSIKLRKVICDWANHEKDESYALKKINQGEDSIGPFSSLVFFNEPALQKKTAEDFASRYFPPNNLFKQISKYKKHEKIRIAYFSPDFYKHPVANLIVELIEKHDKSKFEIYGFSLIDWPDDEINIRLKKAFTKFIDLGRESSENIVKLAREMEIDIAIDLAIYSGGKPTTDIFAMRTAPIQINYLGFPGTSGAAYFDYIIADPILIPNQYKQYYSEKIIYLPSFQANDSKRSFPSNLFSRQELKLPKTGFVFCCFNNSNKFNKTIFDSWIKILSKVDNSVLLLYADNEFVKNNLLNEINIKGIQPNRIIFGERLPMPEYLARYQVVDLFLDTLPFNAGTTASDALRTGLPVLTCQGEAFAGRMGASLLNAVNLPELITFNLAQYESLAIELAINPKKLKKLKNKLIKNLPTAVLYNTPLFTKNIESAYSKIYERYQNNLAPIHIE